MSAIARALLILLAFCGLLVPAIVRTAAPAIAAPAPYATPLADPLTRLTPQQLLTRDPQTLVEPQRERSAGLHMAYVRTLALLQAAAQIVLLFWLWRSGRAAGLRDALRRHLRSPVLVRAAFGVIGAVLVEVVALPFQLAAHRVRVGFELPAYALADWWRLRLEVVVVTVLAAGVVTAGVLWLVERTRLWYIFTALAVFGVVIAGTLLSPWLPRSPVHLAVPARVAYLHAAAMPTVCPSGVLDQDDPLTAFPDEQAFVAAHQSAECALGEPLRSRLFGTSVLAVAVTFAVLVAERVPFRYDDDSLVRLTLVAALIGVFQLALAPVGAIYDRHLEAQADRRALETTHDPAAAVRYLLHLADEGAMPLCPSRWERLYFYSDAPYGARIAALTGRASPCP